jgi:multimeric flavodoxin WrbA
MKVVAFNGSPHKNGNTFDCLKIVCDELQKEGVVTEIVQLAPLKLQPCAVCGRCAKELDRECHGVKDDHLNEALPKLFGADAVIIGSPTWYSNVTGHVKNFIDRCGTVNRANGGPLTRKVGAAVVAVRRAGGIPTFDAINHFFHINGMIVPGSTYWNLGVGRLPGECLEDEEGVQTFVNLGQNVAWLLKKLA